MDKTYNLTLEKSDIVITMSRYSRIIIYCLINKNENIDTVISCKVENNLEKLTLFVQNKITFGELLNSQRKMSRVITDTETMAVKVPKYYTNIDEIEDKDKIDLIKDLYISDFKQSKDFISSLEEFADISKVPQGKLWFM